MTLLGEGHYIRPSPEVGFLAVAKGASLADCAGVASPVVGTETGPSTVAEVASSADIAGAASLAVAGAASLADIAGAASPGVAGVASLTIAGAAPSADIAGVASRAIAGVASSADSVGMASSTDQVGEGCLSEVNDVKCGNDWLADSTCPDIDFPHSDSQSRIWRERDPEIIQAPGVTVLPINKDLPEEEHEAVVVGAIGMGAPGF